MYTYCTALIWIANVGIGFLSDDTRKLQHNVSDGKTALTMSPV